MPHLTGAPGIGKGGPTSQTWTTPFPHKPGDKARDADGNEYLFCNFTVAVAGSGILVSINDQHVAVPLLGTSLLRGRVGVAMTTVAANEGGWAQVYGLAVVQGGGFDNASTDVASLAANTGTVVSDADAGLIRCQPQFIVTTPTGTLNLYSLGSSDGTGYASEIASLVSNNPDGGLLNTIWGMYFLTSGEVSAIPDAFMTARYPTVTSPVSAVSNTSGAVTLTTRATSHHGGEYFVYLNYPYLAGNRTS